MYNDRTKANTMKYMKEKRDKLTLDLPLGAKERYRAHAVKQGFKSLTAMIVYLIERDIKENGG